MGLGMIKLREIDIDAMEWRQPSFVGVVGIIDAVENIVKRKFDRRARNAEPARRRGAYTFPVIHGSGKRRCWIQECSRIKIIGEKGRKKKRAILRFAWSVGSRSRGLAATCGERRILVIGILIVCGDFVAIVHRPDSGPPSLVRIPLEFGRRLHVRLRDWSAVPGGGDRSVDAEGELHTLDGAGFGILASLAAALFLDRTLAQQIGRMVSFKIGSFKLLDAPARNGGKSDFRVEGFAKGRGLLTSPFLCLVCRPCISTIS
jgi:hypothetical protein